MQREESSPVCLGRRGRSAGSIYTISKNNNLNGKKSHLVTQCVVIVVVRLTGQADLIIAFVVSYRTESGESHNGLLKL